MDLKYVVGVSIQGMVLFHVRNVSGTTDHDTLCGIDVDDPSIGHDGIVNPLPGQKVTCKICKNIVLGVQAMRLRKTDFAEP